MASAYRVADIRRDHFNATARLCGLGDDMNSIMDAVVDATPAAVESVGNQLPPGFPPRVFDTITAGLR